MSYGEFLKELKEMLQMHFGENFIIRLNQVRKTNLGELDAILIQNKDKPNICPNFYGHELYREYQKGKMMRELVEGIAKIYEEHGDDITEENSNLSQMDRFYEIKDNIYFRLINTEKNQELLEEIPHVSFLNLVMVFYLLVSNEKEGIGSIRITNELMERWHTSSQELHELAMENTEKLFPIKTSCLQMVLGKFFGCGDRKEPVGLDRNIIRFCAETGEPLVLTNKSGINGFSVILYKDCLKTLGELLKNDFYILPSSIHEGLIIPAVSEIGNPQQLRDMVKEVNESCVEPEEYLSDEIYYFDREKEIIEIVRDGAKSEKGGIRYV